MGSPLHARLLSNGRYSVLLTDAGTGYSICNGYALTHWSGDRTEDDDGFFVYVRDADRDLFWSVGHQPAQKPPETYSAVYEPGRMRIERRDHGIETRLEACVAPDDDVEIRRVSVRNLSEDVRRIELTSYADVVLNHAAAHAAHPVFSKLFVQTEYVPAPGVLLARRRPRSGGEQWPWMLHALADGSPTEYETDRARFLGRGRTLARPLALTSNVPLSGTAGNVLDPIFSLRRIVELGPGQDAQLAFILGTAESREGALPLAARYAQAATVDGVLEGARWREEACLRRFGISEERGEYLQELAAAMLYGDPAVRADAAIIRHSRGSLSDLQQYGARSDALLAVMLVDHFDELPLVRDLLQAQAYWESKGLRVALVALCAEPPALADRVQQLCDDANAVAVCRRAEIPSAHLDLLRAAAHLEARRSLPVIGETAVSVPVRQSRWVPTLAGDRSAPFDNGDGGFSPDSSEYVIRLGARQRPPMPWINVIANESLGLLVSESGAGYTWSRNSRENRLTPWYNDPIADPHGEALYVRDDDAKTFWSPLPGPVPAAALYEVRHGFGYTCWRHSSRDLDQEVLTFVPSHDPLKIMRLRVTNSSSRTRRLSIFTYHRLVLGVLPADSGRFVVTEFDAESQAVLAQNRCNNEFSDDVVFAGAVREGADPVRYTTDRTAFIGRNGCPAAPAALMESSDLDGRTGAGMDPCAALQVTFTIAPGGTAECAFLFGEAADKANARAIVARYRRQQAVEDALHGVREFWTHTLTAIQLDTPSPAIDVMVNGWLLYQTLSCRLWGRSAFYQSGGAFGFRDQLQDAAALIYSRPDLTRAQILLHAAHQFVDGDVLHWWHPPADRGMRTRFSDDLLWLPYVAAFYVYTTGDWGVLDELVGFLTARLLDPGEDEAYLTPTQSGETADVYTHCCRALDRSLTRGAHGLPLMGTGDWNDGMNRVGREGRGESVWLGFFLYRILDDFIPICTRRGDHAHAQSFQTHQTALKAALNDAGWDGQWYRRAYYDDGSPLGSARNSECRIDALAQAWAVISGVAPPQRAVQAMDAVEQHLVSREGGLIRLLTPPFDRDPRDPGYIKGYVPGIRENGGQYTHAAIWVVQALAELGRRDRAAEYLEMLSPISHSRTPQQVAVYQVEPYVVAADIYGMPPHLGRGGWTWYTGSAGWAYRVTLESVLGIRLENGNTLRVKPCIPDEWPRFGVRLRLPDGKTRYQIDVRNPSGDASAVMSVSVDGAPRTIEGGAAVVPLLSDGGVHQVVLTLGAAEL